MPSEAVVFPVAAAELEEREAAGRAREESARIASVLEEPERLLERLGIARETVAEVLARPGRSGSGRGGLRCFKFPDRDPKGSSCQGNLEARRPTGPPQVLANAPCRGRGIPATAKNRAPQVLTMHPEQ